MNNSILKEEESNSVKKFLTTPTNRRISEDFKVGRYEIIKHKRDYIELFDTEDTKTSNIANTKQVATTQLKPRYNLFALVVSIVFISLMVVIATLTFSGTQKYTTFYKSFGATYEEKPKTYKGMVVIEKNSKRVIDEYNSSEKLFMASTTKIMTAIVVIENTSDLEKVVSVPDACVGIEGTSIYLKRGEEISVKDLLFGLMLASGNDCATALAIITSGSETEFVSLMNTYANKLGLENTHYMNPHGLHNKDHYTTALDLAKLTAYALNNPTFSEIVNTKRYTIQKTNKTDKERYLKNKQKLMFDDAVANDGICVTGVKSGFTPEAGRCLVTSASVEGKELIVVVLNCQPMFEETLDLLKKCRSLIDYKMILEPYSFVATLPVEQSKVKEVKIYTKNGFTYPIKADDKVEILLDLPTNLTAPIQKDEVVGKIRIFVNGKTFFETDAYAFEDVKSDSIINISKNLIEQFIWLVIK